MVMVIARVGPPPDRRDELDALLRDGEAASRLEDGCLNYGYFVSMTDPGQFIAVEEWRDMAALEAHLRQPHVARLIAAVPDVVAEPPEIVAHTVAEGGDLPLPT